MLRRVDRRATAALTRSAGLALLACWALLVAPGVGAQGTDGGRDSRERAASERPAAAVAGERSAAPRLAIPVRCTLGSDCFIQNYVDRDPGPGWRDYACGPLAYDGHKGTDFRVRSLADMESGFEVLAAADGMVVATRDGEPDLGLRERGVEDLRGRDAGNGVRIDHGGGWETQYSHLKRGSVRVRRGQRVSAGEVLGLIGLSGRTEFPHLDFAVRHRGLSLDPFAPEGAPASPDDAPQCPQGPAENTLWREEAVEALRYRPSGVLVAGFAGETPDRGRAQRGEYRAAIDASAPALVFWIEVFGLRGGDVERFEILDPDGKVIARREQPVERNYAVRFSYGGHRRGESAWPAGEYLARYWLERSGRAIARTQVRVSVR